MKQRTWFGLALVAVFAIGVLAAPALADPTVTGDPSAWADLKAAWMKLYSLPGFRAKVTTQNGTDIVMEFVPPDSMHMTAQTQAGPMEMIKVGQKTAMKLGMAGAPAGWQCRDIPQPTTMPDLNNVQGAINITREPDTNVNNTPVHAFLYSATTPGSQTTNKGTWYIGIQTGLPVRFLIDGGPGNQSTIDYYDYGAAITITMPPCG